MNVVSECRKLWGIEAEWYKDGINVKDAVYVHTGCPSTGLLKFYQHHSSVRQIIENRLIRAGKLQLTIAADWTHTSRY